MKNNKCIGKLMNIFHNEEIYMICVDELKLLLIFRLQKTFSSCIFKESWCFWFQMFGECHFVRVFSMILSLTLVVKKYRTFLLVMTITSILFGFGIMQQDESAILQKKIDYFSPLWVFKMRDDNILVIFLGWSLCIYIFSTLSWPF